MYNVKITRNVQKYLAKLLKSDKNNYNKILRSLYNLKENPRPNGCKKLKGREGYRVRINNYRIIYDIEDKIKVIEIINIGHRKNIYK